MCYLTLITSSLYCLIRIDVDSGRKREERSFKAISDCVHKVYRTDEIKGIYNRLGVSLLGIFINRGVFFGIYDSGKTILLLESKKDNLIWKILLA